MRHYNAWSFTEKLNTRLARRHEQRHELPLRMEKAADLEEFRNRLCFSWHDPTGGAEENVTASVHGFTLGTSGHWGREDTQYFPAAELHMVFYVDSYPVAMVNLSQLCEWGSDHAAMSNLLDD